MKEISKDIEESIRRCAKHFVIANREQDKILHWFLKNNYDSSINDMIIDCCQNADASENLICFLRGSPDSEGNTVYDFETDNSKVSFEEYY